MGEQAMANSVGSVSIDLEANIAKFTSDIGRAARVAEQRAQEMRKTLGAVAGALGAALSVGAIGAWLKSAVDAQDAISKLSQKVAVSTETLSGWQLAAKQAGVDGEAFQKGLVKLGQSAALASEGSKLQAGAFKSIGVSATEANGHLKSTQVLFEQVADKLSKYRDSTEKTVIATRLFGKAGADLIPLLNAGSTGLAEYTKMADDFGLTVGGKVAKDSERFNDALEQMGFVSKGVSNQIVSALAPAMADLAEKAVSFFRSDDWKSTLDAISTGAKAVADHIGDIIAAVKLLGELVVTVYLGKMIASGIAWIGNLTAQGVAVDALGAKTALSLGATIKNVGLLQTSLNLLGSAVVGWQIGTYLYDQFQIVRDAGAIMIGTLLVGWEKIKEGAQIAWLAIEDSWLESVGRMQKALGGFAQQTTDFLKSSSIPSLRAAGEAMGVALANGIGTGTEKTEAQLKKNDIARTKVREDAEKKIAAIRSNTWSGVGASSGSPASVTLPKLGGATASLSLGDSAASAAANKLKAAYDAMVQTLQSKIAADKEALDVGSQVTAAEKFRAQIIQQMDSGVLKVTQAQRAYMLSLADTDVQLQKTIALNKQHEQGLANIAALEQSLAASVQNQKDSNAIALIGIGHGDEVAQKLRGELQIRQEYQHRLEALNDEATKRSNVGTENGIGGASYNKQLADLKAFLATTTSLYEQQTTAVKAMQLDGMNGVHSAVEDFMSQQQDMAGQMKEFTTKAIGGFSDAFASFASGSESAKKAFGSFIDSMYQQALKFVANQAIAALFKSFDTSGKADTGGGWGSLLGNLAGAFGFGGPGTIGAGLATGGMAYAGSVHPVNENGPEIFTYQNRDYLAAGAGNVKVTPITQARGGGNTNITNVYVQLNPTHGGSDGSGH